MNSFSEKSLLALGEYYVYGLIDPRDNTIFYIGKGSGNRIFQHEQENLKHPDRKKLKLDRIAQIHEQGLEVRKIIINDQLTETEAFASEASLINIYNYFSSDQLTNVVQGHHTKGVLTVEEYEQIYAAEALQTKDIHHNLMVIKINRLYHRGMDPNDLYNTVRGIWFASMSKAKNVDYVLGVYHSLVVAVYKPTKWYKFGETPEKMEREDLFVTPGNQNRLFFVDDHFENVEPMDQAQIYYYGKSIAELPMNQKAQNPVTYLKPMQ